jgi:phosphoglucomutase/phosphomannomutase
MIFDTTTQANLEQWLTDAYDAETRQWITEQIAKNPKALVDAFYTSLSFGTGGLRALMGIGPNRINIYTIMLTTQGLANYIQQQPKQAQSHSVFIGYDCRRNSRLFAEISAQVLAANGIQSFLCKDIQSTPLISFGCRWKQCTAAIMITASHNSAEYNGYKIYWDDGGQIVSPRDKAILKEIRSCQRLEQVAKIARLDDPLIEWVGNELNQAYLKAHIHHSFYAQQNHTFGGDLHIVYTNLHGGGISIIPSIMNSWGFTHVDFIPEQKKPDPLFPTVTTPNPEDPRALALGIKQLEHLKADILLATDPDVDRLAVAVMHKGHAKVLSGNQIACLCLEHICEAYTQQNRWPERAAFIKTLPTTELFTAIAEYHKKPCFNVLTGFKYVAEKIREWERDPKGYAYLFGGEESFGYLLGTQVRDKDAVSAAALLCEIALHAKLQQKSLIELLHALYRRHGVYQEALRSITFPDTKLGKEQMHTNMQHLRTLLSDNLLNYPILSWEDYLSSTRVYLPSGRRELLPFPSANIVVIQLKEGSKLIIRPSGTEPKIKIYGEVVVKLATSSATEEELTDSIKIAQQKVQHLLEEAVLLVS